MHGYLNDLSSMFPQVSQDSGSKPVIADTEKAEPVIADTKEAEPALLSDEEIKAAAEEALFDKLSSALDESMKPAPETDHVETLHDVFEEMLSGKAVDTRERLMRLSRIYCPVNHLKKNLR